MEIKRIFNGPDSDMLKTIGTMLLNFEEYLSDFNARSPYFDAAYLLNWKAVHKKAIDYLPDEFEILQTDVLKENVTTVLQNCQTKNKDVRYFAGRAFPKNKEIMKEFGQQEYNRVRSSPLRMVQYMETLYGVAMKYKAELIAQNFTQAEIDEIDTLATALREENKKQQLKKKARPTETRQRIEALNATYAIAQKVAMFAPVVFRESAAKRQLFFLTNRTPSKITYSWLTLEPDTSRKTGLPLLLQKNTVSLTNQGTETVVYWQSDSVREKPAQKYSLAAGGVVAVEAQNPEKKFLVVQNTSAKTVRLMLTKEKKEKE